MAKKSFAAQGRRPPSPEALAAFVRGGPGTDRASPPPVAAGAARKVRFTFEMPEDLHANYKAACARGRLKMGPDILALVEARLAELER